jgi:CubicO group peptidase (beta-lactamase class C family)
LVLQAIHSQVLEQGVRDEVAPGMAAGLWSLRRPEQALVATAGRARQVPTEGAPITADTIFDLASLTKVLATWALAATLIDRGWLRFETPLAALLPNPAYRDITVEHLLSHTAGFVWWAPLWEQLRDAYLPRALHTVPIAERRAAARRIVLGLVPERAPGEEAVYSDISSLVLSYALEQAAGMSFERAVRSLVWDRLGLEGLHFRPVDRAPADARDERVAATEDSAWRGGVLQGQVHDDNCWAMGGVAGHAGAFGSVGDVLGFARATFEGAFGRETLARSWRRMARPAGCSRTPGWDTPSGPRPSSGSLFSARTVGHLGFAGTSLWIDVDAGLAIALLTNRVHPSRENQKIRDFRPRLHDWFRAEHGLKS